MDVSEFLAGLPHFADLQGGELDALEAALQIQRHPDGYVFLEEGDRGDAVYLVLEGEVAVLRRRGERTTEVNRMRPGDLFGLIALVDRGPRSATCRADGAATVGSLPKTVFSVLFNSHEPIAWAFQRALATQLARDFRGLSDHILAALVDRDD